MKDITYLLRREFLKKAGVGSVAMASLPALGRALPLPRGLGNSKSDSETATNWIFAAFSGALTIGTVNHQVGMEGHGFVTSGQGVQGVGSYVLYDANSAVPKTIFGAGTWQATSLNSFTPIPSWGAFQAGILDMQINLNQIIPALATVAAELKVICNVPAGGLFTGQPEGYVLTIPGAPEGPYSPLSPPIGGSVFLVFPEPQLEH